MENIYEIIKPKLINSSIDKTSFIDILSIVEDSFLHVNSKIYKFSRVRESIIKDNASIGDGSKVDMSYLDSFVRVVRYNHIYNSNISSHSYTGQSTVIMNSNIGKFTSISWGVTIGPPNHDYSRITNHSFLYNDYDKIRPVKEAVYNRFEEECVVGNDVWIGANATILRDVTIGDGAVIGANSLISKDVPPYAIVAGVPGRILKFRFSEDIINELLEIRWWDLPDNIIRENFDIFQSKEFKYMLDKLKILKKKR